MKKHKKNSKKNTKYIKSSEAKKQRAVQFFDRCTLFLLLVVIASLALCFEKPYELEKASIHGPALWFLHLAAWPILFLPGLINNLSFVHNTTAMKYLINDNPALILALLAGLLIAILWLIIRRYGLSWFGVGGMRSAGHFMLIFACWGVLQLIISAVIVLQDTNSLIPFHSAKTVKNSATPAPADIPAKSK
ncbi:MAG: hypothetical protein IKA65_08125 [Lentisphaeria bacterium]|nr:hypothetical protein [Lentisphaeria bacterium]